MSNNSSNDKSYGNEWISAFKNLNIEEMRRILSIDKSVINLQDNSGWTALIYASSEGHFEIVKMLIEAKADLNLQSNYGTTALMHASCNGHTKIAKMLIEFDKDIFIEDNQKRTCLHFVLFW